MRSKHAGLAVLFLSLMPGWNAAAQDVSLAPDHRFAIRIIDEGADPHAQNGPPDDDRLPNSTRGIGKPGWWWLKRQGGIEGQLVEAHLGTGADGQPVVLFSLTPRGRDQFAALTRTNIGKKLAVVVNGTVVTTGIIGAEMTEGKAQIAGYFTDEEARALADEMIATIHPLAR